MSDDNFSSSSSPTASLIELNVGGVHYTTSLKTLQAESDSKLSEIFNNFNAATATTTTAAAAAAAATKTISTTDNNDGYCLIKDAKGRIFLDRDGVLFRYILDYLRDGTISLPDGFRETDRLKKEAEYFRLIGLLRCLNNFMEARRAGCITVGYRGSFQFGKDGLADVKFRKLSRILVCGRVALCRDVFGDTLNESRDPDHGGPDRYTSRFFLKHCFIEQAFDMLQEQGFRLAGSCGSGTAGSAAELKPGVDAEENRWNHYNEFVFIRD